MGVESVPAGGQLGAVELLRRHPVKSMLGEEVPAADVTFTGLEHDRGLALLDRTTGKVASAKYPRRWRGLLALSASAEGSEVRITLPDGRVLRSTDGDVDDVLSELLGRPVTLRATPPPDATLDRAAPEEVLHGGADAEVRLDVSRIGMGSPADTFFDYAPVHLMTTSTLDRIGYLNRTGRADPARYRPNIVISTSADGFVENDWAGRILRIGDSLALRVLLPTPRCAVPTLAHGSLPADGAALRVLAEHNRVVPLEALGPQPCAGVYAQVMRPGRARLGDAVQWE